MYESDGNDVYLYQDLCMVTRHRSFTRTRDGLEQTSLRNPSPSQRRYTNTSSCIRIQFEVIIQVDARIPGEENTSKMEMRLKYSDNKGQKETKGKRERA